jgi:hypothetical protein
MQSSQMFPYIPEFLYFSLPPSIGRDRKDRRRLSDPSPFGEGKRDHQEKERALRGNVLIIDPEPVVAV